MGIEVGSGFDLRPALDDANIYARPRKMGSRSTTAGTGAYNHDVKNRIRHLGLYRIA